MRFFPRTQFLFVQSEELFQRSQATMTRVTEFLGLSPFDGFVLKSANHNQHRTSSTAAVSADLAHSLDAFFHASTQQLADVTGIDWFDRWKVKDAGG
jgi:hypothetical protein